jgi:hypothetical protein
LALVCNILVFLSLGIWIANLLKSQNNDKEIKDSLLDGFHEIFMTVDTIHYSHQFLEVFLILVKHFEVLYVMLLYDNVIFDILSCVSLNSKLKHDSGDAILGILLIWILEL